MNESVQAILKGSNYCSIATVCSDGAPWNVPVRFAFDEKYIYFRSPTGTVHGANIERDGRVSVVVVDTTQSTHGAVYLHSQAMKIEGDEEASAISIFNRRFDNPPAQWDRTEYYKLEIGELDTARSMGEMFYFQIRSTV